MSAEYDKLSSKLTEAREEGLPFVVLNLDTASRILNALYVDDTFKIGDKVEVIGRGTVWHGSVGTVVTSDPPTSTYPISVEFNTATGRGRAMGYFNEHQLKKVEDNG